jgi:hypothetical protein
MRVRMSAIKRISKLRRTPLRQSGKKTRAWAKARKRLKPVFDQKGITTCEAQLEGCLGDDGLGFAHLLKRRNLPDEDLGDPDKVVLLCNYCHWAVEKRGEERMKTALERIISTRLERQEVVI